MTTDNQDKVVQVLTYGWCSGCSKNPAEWEHTCPFKREIYDDYESLCGCCMDCEGNCALDI